MKIKTVKIKNFRSYKDEVEIEFGNLTAFVGKMTLENQRF